MGAYLSQPKTTKESLDCENNRLRCGASAMQGWRVSQEDAHNCILDFDKDASLFAVYDGHGGHEVAEYCSKNLPDFIKKTEAYMKGDYEQALKDAFLGFDETLATPDVIKVLKEIAGCKDGEKTNSDPEAGSESEEEEALDNLVQEAHMPLDEVMAKYKAAGPLCRALKAEGKLPLSPILRARRAGCSGEGSSSSGAGSSAGGSASSGDAEVSSSSSSHVDAPSLCNGDAHVNGEVEEAEDKKTEAESKVDSSEVSQSESVKKCDAKVGRTEPDSSGLSNGESHDVSSSSEKSGAAGVEDEGITSSSPPKKKKVSSVEIYQKLLQEGSDSEEEDETFVAEVESEDGSSDDAGEEAGDKEGAEEEEDEDEDDDDDDSSIDDGEEEGYLQAACGDMEDREDPGIDSGCTAVVALLTGNDLYVANAGDSRCVVCREGKAVEMSFDHKPEDELEKERIEAAGGKVTCDGRINGGLNLSRAIGDHSYKRVALLPPSKQMITALPDIQKITVDPAKDEFMVLACDGIWNSMTSQEVVDFIRVKFEQKTEKLSQICEELFDHCLAPDTMGDGTGCDNMTSVIVQFKPTAVSQAQDSSNKRPADTDAEEPTAKKSKVEGETQPA